MLFVDSWTKNLTLSITDVTFSVTDTDYVLEESDNNKKNICKGVICIEAKLCSTQTIYNTCRKLYCMGNIKELFAC